MIFLSHCSNTVTHFMITNAKCNKISFACDVSSFLPTAWLNLLTVQDIHLQVYKRELDHNYPFL